MQKDAPYIDESGRRFYTLTQASRIITEVDPKTLWNWVAGITGIGFKFDIKRRPMAHHARSFRHDARIHRESRILLGQESIFELKAILRVAGKTEPGPISKDVRDRLEVLAHYRGRIRVTQHQWEGPAPP
jgi:hypothetical protein